MYPAPFNFHRAKSFDEAVTLLAQMGQDAKVIAGGQTLIPMMKLRLLKPAQLIDISRIPGSSGIRISQQGIHIGALTTHRAVAESAEATSFPILKDCAGGIADAQVRSLGTIAGSLAEADPSSCWPTLLTALGASVRCTSPSGEREQRVRDLLRDAYSPALGPAELISEIRIDADSLTGVGAFVAFKRAAAAYPTASCALQLPMRAGRVFRGHMAIGCVGLTPIVVDIDQIVSGRVLDASLLQALEDAASAAAQPLSDNKGTDDYKRSLVRGLVRRAFRICIDRFAGIESSQSTHTYYG